MGADADAESVTPFPKVKCNSGPWSFAARFTSYFDVGKTQTVSWILRVASRSFAFQYPVVGSRPLP
jgi:hypothetical protein